MSSLSRLESYGQRFWLDDLSREILDQGRLSARIAHQGLVGITTNPSIFHNSIGGQSVYDERIRAGVAAGKSAEEIYQEIAVGDVADACDQLMPVFDASGGRDGYVSLEVSPHLAHDLAATLVQAESLWQRVDRPNLYIKVPGTPEGIPAVEELLYRGINVNITLLFGLAAYWDTFQAHMRAMERRLDAGRPVDKVSSVASFFLSRIDSAVDERLRQTPNALWNRTTGIKPESLLGKAAVANAKLAYASLMALLISDRWIRLAEAGARVQRIVWASTSTKDPDYPELMYIEPLIGSNTISTMPVKTADAFDAHGQVGDTVERDLIQARLVMQALSRLGIDFDQVTAQLLSEGVDKFTQAYDGLLSDLRVKCDEFAPQPDREATARSRFIRR